MIQHLRPTTSASRPRFFSGLALLLWLAVLPLSARVLPAPAKLTYSSRSQAFAASVAYATANGGSVVLSSGTPSMEPLIHGQTYAVIKDRPYGSIRKYDLLVYMGRPDASKPGRVKMLHRAVKGDAGGWMMSGDNNRWSESWDRVTPETYVGTVIGLFGFPVVAASEGVKTAPVSG